MSYKLLVLGIFAVFAALFPIFFEPMYNYYVYTAPIKNAIDEYPDFLGDVHYETVPKVDQSHHASISNISPQKDDSIDVDFAQNDYQWSSGYKPIPEFSFAQNIKVNQTFVVICHDFTNPLTREIFKNSTVTDKPEVDVLKYLGPIEILGEIKYKFYHAQRTLQTEMPCDYPQVIEHSINAIDLVVPETFGEEFDQKRSLNYKEPKDVDSGNIDPTKDISVFFEVMLLEQGIEWIVPQRQWSDFNFVLDPPTKICSEILYSNGTNVFLSTMIETPYSLSDMTFHNSLPDDCAKVWPVAEIGKNENLN